MRRGCMIGCFGWLIACGAISLLIWFVAIPRISDALENSVADGFATMIADEVNPLHSRSELQQGTTVRFSFETINESLRSSNQDDNVDSIAVTSSGNQMVIRAEFNGQSFEFGFTPEVTTDGTLDLEPTDEDGWLQEQIMSVLSGGAEKSFNEWLNANDLRLVNVSVEGDSLLLEVEGK